MGSMSIFPLIGITLILTALVGLAIASLERGQVMQNWSSMRCSLPVMVSAGYFKPSTDPRSKSQFSSDNFQFCMKELVQTVTDIVMAPLVDIFSTHAGSASLMNNIMADIRNVVQLIYTTFMSYMKTYFLRFEQVAYQMSKIIQHLRMAMRRVNGIATSLIYLGLSVIRGMMNAIDFFMVVVMIILGIMVALIILLFFVLFPFMPIIMGVLAALLIVATGTMVGTLAHFKHAFCFDGDTRIGILKRTDNCTITEYICISDIKVGDILSDGGKVTAVIETVNEIESLFNINGIAVSGSHFVQKEDGTWNMVEHDSRAHIIHGKKTGTLYCLNTSTHIIPVMSISGVLNFKDWEEFDDDDIQSQYEWNYNVLKMLNNSTCYTVWQKGLKLFRLASSMPLMDGNSTVCLENGIHVPIKTIKIGDRIYDSQQTATTVIGCVYGIYRQNNTLLYQIPLICKDKSGNWKIIHLTDFTNDIYGYTLITESGCFNVKLDNIDHELCIRDFTEVGYNNIHNLYPFIADRLKYK